MLFHNSTSVKNLNDLLYFLTCFQLFNLFYFGFYCFYLFYNLRSFYKIMNINQMVQIQREKGDIFQVSYREQWQLQLFDRNWHIYQLSKQLKSCIIQRR
ncbi:unnamed protein product [Paramecium sonneborni]|uniref:Transmembrane protein n=1 Tax=Paramecium sonneborni TaxID=65129 RepID=A0A8S1R1Z1_9CILI|nr:unnamed protein product [Paramecium sonneborni]